MTRKRTRSRATRRVTVGLSAASLLTTCLVAGALAQSAPADEPRARLLADTDRDGRITPRDAADKDVWRQDRGAIALPNIDDDGERCPSLAPGGARLTDDRLAACHDGSDERVNGAADAEDLLPLRVEGVADARPSVRASLTVDEDSAAYTRLFVRTTDAEGASRYTPLPRGGKLTARQVREGADLALEVTDLVRDPERWNGLVDLTLTVTDRNDSYRDRVQVRVAPVLLTHDLLPVDRLVVSDNATPPERAERAEYDPEQPAVPTLPGEEVFQDDLVAALADAGVDDRPLSYPTDGDQWMRDQFITGYALAPGPDGTPRRMSVLLRSADVMPEGSSDDFPLRDAGRPLFSVFRGPDTAAVQEFTPERVGDDENNMLWGSFSSTGNFLVTPPYQDGERNFPAGRVLYGSDGQQAAPDPAFTRLLQAQGEQDPLAVDTSWLGVGHIDEFLSFVPADNERGWAALVADADWGQRLLQERVDAGEGDQPLISGVPADSTPHPGLTVAEALELPELRTGTRLATEGIDAALRVLTEELGLGEDDVVRVPALFGHLEIPDYPRQEVVSNYLPAIANGLQPGTDTFLAPLPHGPRDASGQDVFQRATIEALSPLGVRVAWVEDWEYGHAVGTVGGELHCVTNALRDLTAAAPWWD